MDAASEVSTRTPQCSCGNGNMELKCAGYTSENPGRFYYKCPTGKNHWKGFYWYDEYHRIGRRNVTSTAGSSRSIVFSQPTTATPISQPASPNVVTNMGLHGSGLTLPRSYLEFICAVLGLTIFVLILGIVMGKLM